MVIERILPWIGGLAALLTSLSYVPQVRKALPRGATEDLSLKTLGILTAGLSVWILYGALRGDWVIMLGGALIHCVVSQAPRRFALTLR
ncbi:MtN3 and saliva related transmembrane protein [Bradyrhizobium sp. NFR13]|uniref:SemiSWEET family sugar transporter n=1 Tax=Bradyrhizobium sp. NFR13 TaxID=1566285 RepID=UPI0008F2A633|nr:PQ-loop domain-containing transporter [Bradyrhizobium sp. NFR13]SFM13415.1 MtN3 and saliva related transmembrane protein [Bradyrhizobium sp. NFR13]